VILNKRTNLSLFAQGTAALIPGSILTYYLISMLSDSQNGGFGIETGIATFLGLSMAFGRVIGCLIFGIIGDHFGKDKRNERRLYLRFAWPFRGSFFC